MSMTLETKRIRWTEQIKDIIPKDEPMTPGLLYVGVATLTGSVIGRNRKSLCRQPGSKSRRYSIHRRCSRPHPATTDCSARFACLLPPQNLLQRAGLRHFTRAEVYPGIPSGPIGFPAEIFDVSRHCVSELLPCERRSRREREMGAKRGGE